MKEKRIATKHTHRDREREERNVLGVVVVVFLVVSFDGKAAKSSVKRSVSRRDSFFFFQKYIKSFSMTMSEKERLFAVTHTNETRKKRPKWRDGYVRVRFSSSGAVCAAVLCGGESVSREEVTREEFATRGKKAVVLAKVSKEATARLVLEKLTTDEDTIEEFEGFKVQVDEEFGADGKAVRPPPKQVMSLFQATRSAAAQQPRATSTRQNPPTSFRNPMFTRTTTATMNTFTPMQSLVASAKECVGKRARSDDEEEMNDIGVGCDVGTASKENEQPCTSSAKQQKRVDIAATLKEKLAKLTKQKEQKKKAMEMQIAADSVEDEVIVAAGEEGDKEHAKEEPAMVPQRVVNYGNTNISYTHLQQQHRNQQNINNNQYRYAEPSITIQFPFEKVSSCVTLRFEGGVREYQNYLLSTSCEQLSLKLRSVSDAIRTVVQTLPQKKSAPFEATSAHVSTAVDPKNLGIRLGRQYRIHYWSACKITAYKTQTKKDEETGTLKPSKTIVELTLGKCEHHKPKDFAKGDVYVISTDPGFFLSSSVAKNTRQGMDAYQNWTGVVASTWHAPDKDGKMHVEMLGELPRTLRESLKNSSNGGWVKRKSITVYAARALSAFGELEEMKNALEMVKEDTMPLMRMIMNPPISETNSRDAENDVHDEEEDFQDVAFTFQHQYGLNHDQAIAMKDMVNKERGVSLVHGPFGSGKTKLVASFIREHVAREKDMQHKQIDALRLDTRQRNGRILVCANTNVAVDRVLKTLLENGFADFCRVGSLTKIDADILPFSIHAKRDSKKGNTHIEELEKALKENEKIASRKKRIEEEIKSLKIKGALQKRAKLVKSAPVVAVTCSSCVNKHLEDQKFDILILDECSQMTEICSLLPLARFGVKHLIAVGDPNQLPPVLESNLESPTISEKQPTLFVRLAELGLPVTLLRTQYRMHPLLSEVPNVHFYESKLLDGVSANDRGALLEGVPPLVFFDTQGENAREERGGQSKFNASEAHGCAVIARELLNRGLKPKDIGIIAFYRAQVDCVNSYLERMRVGATGTADILATSDLDDEESGEIQVSTVDAFQGQEKKVIILTLCGAFKGSNSFTTRERLNVALTRSQRHEFIVADSNEIGRDCHALRDILTKARKTPSGYHPASRCIDDVVSKWPPSVTATLSDFGVEADIKRNSELNKDDENGDSEDVVCAHEDVNIIDNDISSPSRYNDDSEEEEEEEEKSEPSPPYSPEVEEKVQFDMNEAERTNEYDPSTCPQEYIPIISKLEELQIQPDGYYSWYKKLSRALLFRVQADRQWCEADDRLRTMLRELCFPGVDNASWNWTSKPFRRAIVERFFPAFACYVHKHFGFECTRIRKLIEKYDDVDALQRDETGYGQWSIREAETQEASERGARWLTRKLSLSE